MTGKIFNIQRYSIQDGPGIRTTVFLKGCPLRCPWCANPESWATVPELFYTKSKCIRCFQCVGRAKEGEITRGEEGPLLHWERCSKEAATALSNFCPTGALSVKYREIEPGELLKEIEKDLPFYERSGGGVTFSGGEPLLQKDFLLEVLKMCVERGIHTAIETTGCVPWEVLEGLKGYVDLYLFDVKHLDAKKHRKATGSDNVQILQNLRKLSEGEEQIHVRVPVIPGFNDEIETLKKIGELLNALNIHQRTLLPFHQYGSSKFKALGMNYSMEKVPQMGERQLAYLASESHFYCE